MLDFHFEDNITQRSDNNSEKSMVLMLRTDAVIVNKIVGDWLIKKNRIGLENLIFPKKDLVIA